MNQYESDVAVSELKKHGIEMVPFGDECEVAIINTCAVTAESDRKSRQMIRRAATFAEKVAVTGCYAQLTPDCGDLSDKVVYVCGNSGKASLADVIIKLLDGESGTERDSVTPPDSPSSVGMKLEMPNRTRSYIKIEDGCENVCSYCIINKARGPVRSKSPSLVIEEAASLASHGCREVILTGIETASYGMDFEDRKPYGYHLADLITEIARINGIERIGLGSLEPTVATEYFASVVAGSAKALPHFHLSLQSGSSSVLRRMRRRYNARQASEAVARMRKYIPDATFSADIIVGFPGETEEEFAETVRFCRDERLLHLHIFPYSKRAGTEAAGMPDQVPENLKHERAEYLEKLGDGVRTELLNEYIERHRSCPVFMLTEKCRGGASTGHSEHFVEVKAEGCASEIGEIVPVVLERIEGSFCVGRKYTKE